MVANNNLLWTFAITALLGSGSGFIAWSLNGPRFLFWKFILAVLAIVLVVISLFSLLDWVAIEVGRVRYTLAMRETLSPSLRVAEIIARMDPEQLAYMRRYASLEVLGRMGPEGVSWTLVGARGVDIPVYWVRDYIRRSARYSPKLYPVRGRDEDRARGLWDSTDTVLAQSLTDLLVDFGLAEKVGGSSAAVLLISHEELESRLFSTYGEN